MWSQPFSFLPIVLFAMLTQVYYEIVDVPSLPSPPQKDLYSVIEVNEKELAGVQ